MLPVGNTGRVSAFSLGVSDLFGAPANSGNICTRYAQRLQPAASKQIEFKCACKTGLSYNIQLNTHDEQAIKLSDYGVLNP